MAAHGQWASSHRIGLATPEAGPLREDAVGRISSAKLTGENHRADMNRDRKPPPSSIFS
jgi:hypothetical protein